MLVCVNLSFRIKRGSGGDISMWVLGFKGSGGGACLWWAC
jgi:hypothetical protein